MFSYKKPVWWVMGCLMSSVIATIYLLAAAITLAVLFVMSQFVNEQFTVRQKHFEAQLVHLTRKVAECQEAVIRTKQSIRELDRLEKTISGLRKRCPSGWKERDSRCFHMSNVPEMWADGRRQCRRMGGDLAVVQSLEDQLFFTDWAFMEKNVHSGNEFLTVWIGLRDMSEEGKFVWVNDLPLNSHQTYWKKGTPNNQRPWWSQQMRGQDCVAVVPPDDIDQEDWFKSWDDVTCFGKRHFFCERPVALNG